MNRIKKFRTELGISQQRLATECGWIKSYSRIGNYESNIRIPSIKDCRVIVNALSRLSKREVTLDDIFPPDMA